MHQGVVVDCGPPPEKRPPRGADVHGDYWLQLYVMLSRATRSEDLLLMRAPAADFLLQGPPADLKSKLATFANRTGACRRTAEALVRELGFESLLH